MKNPIEKLKEMEKRLAFNETKETLSLENVEKEIQKNSALIEENSSKIQVNSAKIQENLDKIIHDNVKLEKNFFIKITPLFLKNLVMRIVYSRVGEVLQTVCFSNIGLVNLPESVSSHVKALTFAITPTFSCGHQVGALGYNGKLYVTFTRNFVETTIEKNFVRQLTAKGVKVKVHSNYWESKL